jgi:chromosome segregation ATPase
MFVEHTEEPVSIFGMKLEIKDEFEELKEHCDELELINQKVMEENEQLKEYNTDLKQSLDWANEKETEWSNRIEELKTDLEYAKAIIKALLNNSHEYSRQNAEDFVKGEKK